MPSQNGTNKVPHTTRILIVDDEPLMRMALGQALTDSGSEVIEATDAHSATETLAGSSPFPPTPSSRGRRLSTISAGGSTP